MAEKLLSNNFIQFLGSDVHREDSIYKKIPQILENLKNDYGEEKINLLTDINPNLVLENKDIISENVIELKMSFKDKMLFKKEDT